MSFYNNVYKIFAKPFRLMFGLHIHGEENLPEEGGWLVCANHTSALDVIIVSLATRRQVMYMAKAELFRVPVIRKLLSSLGAYPVHRGGADVTSIKKAISYLEEGDLVGIFPQGYLIGSVESIEPMDNGLSYCAVIRPSVDLENLKNVIVIKDFAGKEQQDAAK